MKIESTIITRDKRTAGGVSVKSGYQKLSESKSEAWRNVIERANIKNTPKDVESTQTESINKKSSKKKKKSWAKKKFKNKPILKKARVTIKIKEHEPAPYISRFIKDKIEEDKRNFFFK